MVCVCKEYKYTLFYKHNVYNHILAEIHSKLSVKIKHILGLENKKFHKFCKIPQIFRNPTNFAKVNAPKINQNTLTAKKAHTRKRQNSQNKKETNY